MSTFKLYTFSQTDSGEVPRLILLQSGQKFEEVRVNRKEEWPKLKDQMPWGSLPVLEVDGKRLGGTVAIAEYLGEKLGLAADGDAWSRAQLNSICDIVLEATIVLSRYWSEKDPDVKAKKKAEILKEALPKVLAKINKRIQENGSPDGYSCCNQLTYADFFIHFLFHEVLTRVYHGSEQEVEAKKYPGVRKLCETIHKQPNLKSYLDSRRGVETEFCWDC